MNEAFWEDYYREPRTLEPTAFAMWCRDKLPRHAKILDVGCGNGRDSYYFASHGHYVTGVDLHSAPESRSIGSGGATFVQRGVDNLVGLISGQDAVYSRFFLHAAESDVVEYFATFSAAVLDRDGLFFAEYRSPRGEFPTDGKYRGRLDKLDLCDLLERQGLRVCQLVESHGLAVVDSEDPLIVRVVARKEAAHA